ncbi:MAG TPA: Rnase Y domain-containing protein, partial [Solirubrobacteraceae bacterium]|nr:Rnase Y domain-containing protein [Solirubrobacteraceae bacterium]
MEIIGAAALIAVGIIAAAITYGRMRRSPSGTEAQASKAPGRSPVQAGQEPPSGRVSKDGAAAEWELTQRMAEVARREEAVARRESDVEREREELAARGHDLVRALEQVAGLPASRAKQLLLQEIEEQAKHDSARRLRQIEEETKREAERRVRNILSVCMQRLAAGHAAETTVSVVHLASDEMKGRIIGREGRNIRALENLTGVDFIIDDTPGA